MGTRLILTYALNVAGYPEHQKPDNADFVGMIGIDRIRIHILIFRETNFSLARF